MEKLHFAKNINGTDETGLIDISSNPPAIFCYCAEDVSKKILSALEKAKSYDKLEERLASFYSNDDEDRHADIMDIGEAAASHFGFC